MRTPPGIDKTKARENGVRVAAERRRSDPSSRRIHAISEREYTDEENAFISAVILYQQSHAILFMTATDYLAVLKFLGYQKTATA
ncbi:MAG TPA: hypothetical protein VN719_09430 [Gemmatimonadales bacterium]|nr:hypothetical protein [Gemmatimonadales bacterium]